MKKLFWKIVKWAADKWLQKKIDGDKPKTETKPVEKTRFNMSRLDYRAEQNKKEKP